MPPWLRKTLIITGILIFLLIIGYFLARYFTPNKSSLPDNNTLPGILNKLSPKAGDIDNISPDPTGGLLDADQLVINDKNLVDGQKKIAEMESTLITYRKKLTEAEEKLTVYKSQQDQPEGDEITEAVYGSDFSSQIAKLEQSIKYYNKIIFVYEQLVQKFKGSIAYYYCNGFTPKLPGETVDISKLAYNIIIVNHTNGTTSQISCGWDGVPTQFAPDSPFHPKNFFDGLPPEFIQNNPFENVSFNYESEDQWGSFTPQLTDTVWTSTPPVWSYYLQVFFTLYIEISVDISIDISGLWKTIFDAYPVDDISRYENVHIWVDRYKTFTNNGVLTVWGLLQTGHEMNKVCPVLRMGLLANASWHYTLTNGKKSINYVDKPTCLAARQADPFANPTATCEYTPGTKPDITNPPQKLKDFFKNVIKDIKDTFTLKYYMDGLQPGSIQEFPINIVDKTNWSYQLSSGTKSAAFDTKDICTAKRDSDPNSNKSISCEYSFVTNPCSATVPGQSKHWYITIPDYDDSQPYLFDIVDAFYKQFNFNWFTFTVESMAYRYWGPQFISQTDTQHVYATLLQRLNVATKQDQEDIGFPQQFTYKTGTGPSQTSSQIYATKDACDTAHKADKNATHPCTSLPYATAYHPDDKTLDVLFRIQIRTDERVRGQLDSDPNSFALPLELQYTKTGANTVQLVSQKPTLISKRTDSQGHTEKNDISTAVAQVYSESEYDSVYLYYSGVPGLSTDTFKLVDVKRGEVLVEGEFGGVETYREGAWADKWYYIVSYSPEKFSSYYNTKVECEEAGKIKTGSAVKCYLRKIQQLRIDKLSEHERNENGDEIGTKFTAKKGKLVYRVSTWGQPVTFGLSYGTDPTFAKMTKIVSYAANTPGLTSAVLDFNFPDLEEGKQYYYKLFHAGSGTDEYNSAGYLTLEDSTGKAYPIFDAGAFIASGVDKKLSFDDIFNLNTGALAGLNATVTPGTNGNGGLVPCGFDLNKDGKFSKDEECNFNFLIGMISNVLQFILFVLLPGIVLFFVAWAAYLFMTQGDRPESINRAKDMIKWTMVGTLVMLLSWYIISLLFNLLGLQDKSWLSSGSNTVTNSNTNINNTIDPDFGIIEPIETYTATNGMSYIIGRDRHNQTNAILTWVAVLPGETVIDSPAKIKAIVPNNSNTNESQAVSAIKAQLNALVSGTNGQGTRYGTYTAHGVTYDMFVKTNGSLTQADAYVVNTTTSIYSTGFQNKTQDQLLDLVRAHLDTLTSGASTIQQSPVVPTTTTASSTNPDIDLPCKVTAFDSHSLHDMPQGRSMPKVTYQKASFTVENCGPLDKFIIRAYASDKKNTKGEFIEGEIFYLKSFTVSKTFSIKFYPINIHDVDDACGPIPTTNGPGLMMKCYLRQELAVENNYDDTVPGIVNAHFQKKDLYGNADNEGQLLDISLDNESTTDWSSYFKF